MKAGLVLMALAANSAGGAAMAQDFAASAQDFATRAQAMDYIAATLPKATAANPAFVTKADGTVSKWLTQDVAFSTGAHGAVTVTMRETYTQTQNGKTTDGRHAATFSLAALDVSDFTAPRRLHN